MDYRLKIMAAGWETFTGPICAVQFQDGVSVDVVDRLHIDRISAILLCDLVDEEGHDIGQAGATTREAGRNVVEAPLESLETMTPEALAAERKAALEAMLRNPASRIYTEEELEVLAAKDGIKGVREIGDKWGVKERSIGKLIFLILQVQSEYLAKVKDRDAKLKADREAAMTEALAKQAQRQAEIDAQARVLTPDGTSNAIGEGGEAVFTDPSKQPEIDPALQKQPPGTVPVSEVPANEWPETEAEDA